MLTPGLNNGKRLTMAMMERGIGDIWHLDTDQPLHPPCLGLLAGK